MTERKKKLISLILSTSFLFGLSGCGTKGIEKSVDENNNIVYSGELSLKDMNNIYVVEIINVNNERDLYLTIKGVDNLFNGFQDQYICYGLNDEITDQCNNYVSSYGEVENIIPFNQFLPIYSEVKKEYTAEEIYGVFECIKKDYEELMKNDKVKKLELK